VEFYRFFHHWHAPCSNGYANMNEKQTRKVAFAIWNQRIAPVFDVARTICMVTVASGQTVEKQLDFLHTGAPVVRVAHLVEQGIDTLVCGAISQSLQNMLIAKGIRVIAFVAGDFQEVYHAWLHGKLGENTFAMPGCGATRRQERHGRKQEEMHMKGQRRGGKGGGGGQGQGQGQGSRRTGQGGGAMAAGPTGECICPQCGSKEVHERGVPCTQKKCAKCGAAMTRQ
jgi:predicted Fe-Mo cluster-binding NifX family protein